MTSRLALPAKLTRPQGHALLARERLFACLDAAESTRCIWIAAPAGAGKTSLVTSWIDARKLRCAWYRVDSGDADPAALFHYLGRVAAAVPGRRRLELPHLTPEFLPALPLFVLRFFEAFFARFKNGCTLVLDNCHEVAAESPFHLVLAAALDTVPPGSRVIGISRQDAPPALARWRTDPAFRTLGWDDLRLSDDEAATLVQQTRPGARVDAVGLNARARGWAAGLKLLLESDAPPIASPDIRVDRSQTVFDYLATEIFNRMPAVTRDVLIKTALMPAFTVAIAQRLVDTGDVGAVLTRLYRDRLFVDRRVQGQTITYDYHPLFREFLAEQAQLALGSEGIKALRHRAAALLEEAGDSAGAVQLAGDAGDWPRLYEIVRREAPILMLQGRSATLEQWIGALPSEQQERDPWLQYWIGHCRSQRHPELGRGNLAAANRLFGAAGDRAGALLATGAIVSSFFAAWGRDAEAVAPWIAEFERLLVEGDVPRDIEALVYGHCQAMLYHRPEHPELHRLAERAEALAPELKNPVERYAVGGLCLNYFAWRGEFIRARQLADRIELLGGGPPTTMVGVMYDIWRSVVLWQMAEHEAAEQVLRATLACADASGLQLANVYIHMMLAFSALSRGDLAAANRHLDLGWPGPEPWQAMNVQAYRMLRAVGLSLAGRTTEGATMARAGHLDAAGHASPFSRANSATLCGYAVLLDGHHDEARARFAEVLEFARAMPSYALQFEASIPLAWSLLQTGEKAAGLETLRAALALGRAREFRNCHPLWVPRIMSDLLATALEYRIEVDYARRLISWRRLTPPSNRPTVDAWPWPVRIYTLGRFGVKLADQPLVLPPRAPKKPLDLLKALVALGSRGVTVDSLIRHLWPDLDGDAARNAFGVALHRARKLLRDDDAIVLYEGKLSLDAQRVWVDAWHFERATGALETTLNAADGAAIAPDDPADRARALAANVLRIYLGQFLAGEDAPWILGHRERLRNKFLRAVATLSGTLEASESWEDALDLHRRAIEVDPLAESSHRGLMRILKVLGRRVEAIDAYHRCVELLDASGGFVPSPQTRALYTDLRDANSAGS